MNPFGLKNLGGTCYLNALLQCLYSSADFIYTLKSRDNDEVCQMLLEANVEKIIDHFELPRSSSCCHNAWMKMIDSDLEWIKKIFEVEYLVDGKQEVQTEIVGPLINNYIDECGRKIQILQLPIILMIVSSSAPEKIEGYKLVSVVHYTGGHYFCIGYRSNGKCYKFDDSSVTESLMIINNQCIMYLYERL